MRVDRQAIFDAVAEKSIFHKTAIGAILEAAGHFELVQKMQQLEQVVEAARQYNTKCTCVDCIPNDTSKWGDCPEDECPASKLAKALADLDALGGGKR